jgi:transketolase
MPEASPAPSPTDATSDVIEPTDLDRQVINTIRFLAVDAVEKAQSGHPGMPMGAAPMAYVLWTRHLTHDPAHPHWPDRDRFILSAGHGSMLQYALLHLTGYDLPMSEMANFRQWGSRTPGHPENGVTDGVEVTTGPLGQGFANGVGMAVAERYLAAHFNTPDHTLVDHHTYGIVSDGDLMEGISSEAASLAGHQGLGKLVYLYDDNHISIDGSTDLAFTEDVDTRFEAFGWHVQSVEDGTDLPAIDRAIQNAKAETDRPSLVRVRTHIGYGSPNKQDTAASHGAPLGADEVERTKDNLGWPQEPTFHVPDAVYDRMNAVTKTGTAAYEAWTETRDAYADAHPGEYAKFERWMDGRLPEGWDAETPDFEPGEMIATRKAAGITLSALAPKIGGHLLGGSADLSGSNKTEVEGRSAQQADNPSGSYFYFGVREHAMAGAANGMSLHGGLRPYVGTFLIFSDYMRPSLRLSALSEAPVIYVFTHDSIGLGEDGPTHQPIEHLSSLRAMPNLTLIRPADGPEAAQAWIAALRRTEGPTALSLTRQKVPVLDRTAMTPADGLHRGAYVLDDDDGTPDVILIGTGSEVQHAVAAADTLRAEDGVKVRVVSMPSWELFEAQPAEYRDTVLPPDVSARVAVEAASPHGWERYVGSDGAVIGIDRFGASAPGDVNMQKFGFTPENVAAHARQVMGDG